jgi:hypothetical protein
MFRENPKKGESKYLLNEEVPEGCKNLVTDWLKRVDRNKELNKELFKRYDQNRKIVSGEKHTDGEAGLVRTNLAYSTMAVILPQIYAKNPDISITPSEAVDPTGERYKTVKQFCKTGELVLRRQVVRDAKLKRRAKTAVRSAMTAFLGWVKVQYQKDATEDPIIKNRINDEQDNLKHLEALTFEINTDEHRDNEAKKKELQHLIDGLNKKVEVVHAEGMVIDNPLFEHVLLLDESVTNFDDYEQSSAIAQEIWFTEDRMKDAFGEVPKGATEYAAPNTDQANRPTPAGTTSQKFYCVYEIWSKAESTILTLARGYSGYLRMPYQPERLGERWYPFFALAFNLIDGRFYGISDVDLVAKLQDEYNQTRENFRKHREESLPVKVIREGGNLAPEDVEKITHRKINDFVVIKGAGGRPLSDDMFNFENVPMDAAVYDTQQIRMDIDMVSGSSEAARSSIKTPKTATEAEIMQLNFASRTSERQDAIEDFILDIAQYSLEILLQELTEPQVKRIAGESAVWPAVAKEQVFDLVEVEIRSGSTGRPNKSQEREQWTKLLPELQKSVQAVVEARAAGNNDMADAVVELVKETLVRFDERIDIDRFIPPSKKDEQPEIPPEVQQKMQEMQVAVQELQQENQDLKAKEASTLAKIEADKAIAIAAEQAKGAEAVAKTAADQAQADREDKRLIKEKEMELASTEKQALITAAMSLIQTQITAAAKPVTSTDGNGEKKIEQPKGMSPEEVMSLVETMMTRMQEMIEKLSSPRISKPTYGADGRISEVESTLRH